MGTDLDILWRAVEGQFALGEGTVHGVDHWRRVERNGLLIAKASGAKVAVVRLFAVFHDSRRVNDGSDIEHGARGAALAKLMHGSLFELDEGDLRLLEEACCGHTVGKHHADPTIGTCWDADRLDLGRVGMIPDEEYMSTDLGRKIAREGLIGSFMARGS